ncbi:MAG: PEP-CTERM sorting domain-containing protein, partial [Pirellulales bacterium]
LVYTDPLSGITINGESGAIPTIGQPGTAWGFMPGTTNPVLTPEADSGSVFMRSLLLRDSTEVRWGGLSFMDAGEQSDGANELLYIGTTPTATRDVFGFHNQAEFNGPAGISSSTVPFNANQVYFIVSEVDIDNDIARLWINPAFGPTPPTPDLEISFDTDGDFSIQDPEDIPFTGKIGSIRMKTSTLPDFETNDKYMTADEMVIGTTWGDVVPTVPTPPSANFDGDTDVDGHDFLIWQRGFGGPGVLSTGDANGDLVVDGVDLGIWQGQFGTTGLLSAVSAITVPEPGTLALATLAAGLACLVRRKRSL